MTTIRQRVLVLAAGLAFFSLALRSEQPQKVSRATQEDRLKKLEGRADAAEKAASSAVMEQDYLTRTTDDRDRGCYFPTSARTCR